MNDLMINLTSVKTLTLTNLPKEIMISNTDKASIQILLAKLNNFSELEQLCQYIGDKIFEERTILNSTSEEEKVDFNNVAIVIDTTKCDPNYIVPLNSFYQMYDINNIKPLSIFSDMQTYGETLLFLEYEFFPLVLKCMCTVNTRIGRLQDSPSLMSSSEYEDQDFLVLIKKITEAKAFTLEIGGRPHDITVNEDRWITVDDIPITLLSELNKNMHKILFKLYEGMTDPISLW